MADKEWTLVQLQTFNSYLGVIISHIERIQHYMDNSSFHRSANELARQLYEDHHFQQLVNSVVNVPNLEKLVRQQVLPQSVKADFLKDLPYAREVVLACAFLKLTQKFYDERYPKYQTTLGKKTTADRSKHRRGQSSIPFLRTSSTCPGKSCSKCVTNKTAVVNKEKVE